LKHLIIRTDHSFIFCSMLVDKISNTQKNTSILKVEVFSFFLKVIYVFFDFVKFFKYKNYKSFILYYVIIFFFDFFDFLIKIDLFLPYIKLI